MARTDSQPAGRRGRRLSDVSTATRRRLALGEAETANWTEWMATDMSRLARGVTAECRHHLLAKRLQTAADAAVGLGILDRLSVFGRAVSDACESSRDPAFQFIASHRSDVVRQWAAYAVNDRSRTAALDERCRRTLPFAADTHMSVRECAWMAFRPHLIDRLDEALLLLEPLTRSLDANVRRFAVEVCRPRSVWGRHIAALKQEPERALAVLENVNQDTSRYVRLAAGNWLNDASKSRPDWVRSVCARWAASGDRNTQAIVARGLRTLAAVARQPLCVYDGAADHDQGGVRC
jgi:3-methyladenine DNA glycosylase AlkC